MKQIIFCAFALALAACSDGCESLGERTTLERLEIELDVWTEVVEVNGITVAVTEVHFGDTCVRRQAIAVSGDIELHGVDDRCESTWGYIRSCAEDVGCSHAHADKGGNVVWEHDSPAYAEYEGHRYGQAEYDRAADFFDEAVELFLCRQGDTKIYPGTTTVAPVQLYI